MTNGKLRTFRQRYGLKNYSEPLYDFEKASLWRGDFFDLILPKNSVDAVVTSPRYNAGIEYDNITDLTNQDKYFDELLEGIHYIYHVLKPGGHIIYVMPPYISVNSKTYENNGKEWKYDSTYRIFPHGINLIDEVQKKTSTYEHPLWFTGAIPWIKTGGVKSSQVTAIGSIGNKPHPVNGWELVIIWRKGHENRNGRTGKTPDSEFMRLMSQPWYVNAETRISSVDHPVPYSVELVSNILTCYTFEGETVLDPFMGSGTTGIAALEMGRKFWGVDISQKYVDNSLRRLGLDNSEIDW